MSNHRNPSHAALAVLCAGLAALLGCSAPQPKTQIASALAHADEQEPWITLQDLRTSNEVGVWDFAEESEREIWDAIGAQKSTFNRAMALVDVQGRALIRRNVEIDPDSVHALRVEIGGAHSARLRLSWARRNTRFTDSKSIQILAEGIREPILFDLIDHPEWRGEVHKVQLEIAPYGSLERVTVRRIRQLRYQTDEESLSRLAQSSVQAGIQGEARRAYLALPGVSSELETAAPGRLRFATGYLGRARDSVRFVVEGEIEGDAVTLYDEQLSPKQLADWRESTIDIPENVGRLQFLTEPSWDYDIVDGLPLWGHPEMLRPAPSRLPPNVILISIDTLARDHLSLYGYDRPTTPRLDERAAAGRVFEQTVVSAPWTLPSHWSMLTGLDALTHGINRARVPTAGLATLAESLRASGYDTHGVTGGGFVSPSFGFSRGFRTYKSFDTKSVEIAREEMDTVIRRSRNTLSSTSYPFFLFFHTFAVHSPFFAFSPQFDEWNDNGVAMRSPYITTGPDRTSADDGFKQHKSFAWGKIKDPQERRLGQEEDAIARLAYDSGIARMDQQLDSFFEWLEDRGLLDNTIVILTSDHGEAFGPENHGHGYLSDDNLLVPLIVWGPGIEPGRTGAQVRSIDIVPTVLELLDIEQPAPVDGRSLASLLRGETDGSARPAWSYAQSSHRGLALSTRREKSVIRDSVFHRGPRTTVWQRDQPVEAPAEALDRATSLAGEALGRLPGVHLTIAANAATGTLRLHGPEIERIDLLSNTSSCDCARWKQGGLELDLVEAAVLDLTVSGHPTRLFLTAGGHTHEMDLFGAQEHHVELNGDGWSEAAGAQPLLTVDVTRQGRDLSGTAAALDPGLTDQLRALGYVN